MDSLSGSNRTHHRNVSFGEVQRSAAPLLDIGLRQIAVHRCSPIPFTVDEPHRAKAGLASLDCLRQHRFEHRLQFTRRTADHLEHIGGGRLLLERFAQLVEQPCILDSDDGLIGEGLQQFNLSVGKRAGLSFGGCQRT